MENEMKFIFHALQSCKTLQSDRNTCVHQELCFEKKDKELTACKRYVNLLLKLVK